VGNSKSPFFLNEKYRDIKKEIIRSIKIIPVTKIYPHEETIFENIVKLAHKIQSDQKFTWPIFAETNSGVILDGMHRWQVMTSYKYILIQEIQDYARNENIQVGVWCRILKDVKSTDIGFLNNALKKYGLSELVKVGKLPQDPIGLEHELRSRKNMILIGPDRNYYKFEKPRNLVQEYKDMIKVEELFGEKVLGQTKFYDIERNSFKLIGEPNSFLIFPRPTSKRDIIRITLQAKKDIEKVKPLTKVLPPKSSRHIMQLRVFNLSIPLKELNSSKSAAQLTKELHIELNNKRVLYLGENVTKQPLPHYRNLDRHYEEHMFKFY
jgi:hypothetical protein